MFKRSFSGRAWAALLGIGLCATFAVPVQGQTAALPQTQMINNWIAKSWADNEIKPSPKARDHEFCRRVFLDLIGRIPTNEEVRDFEGDRRPTKRAELVHRLLYETKYQPKIGGRPVLLESKGTEKTYLEFNYVEEHAEHWSNIWTTWLLTRTAPAFYREKMSKWLEEQFIANTPHNELVVKLLTATGKTDTNPPVAFIIQHLGEMNPVDKQREDGVYDAVPITSRTTRLFLGVQTQCTQCHDHPFNPDWKQDNFWGVNAFFRQVDRNPPVPRDAQDMSFVVELLDKRTVNRTATVFFERRSGLLQEVKATFLKDVNIDPEKAAKANKTLPIGSKMSRRELLAEYIVQHDNFAPALVNRVWGHLFGRGLNEQAVIDDFGEHNKLVHPELMAELSKNFIDYKYDSKQLLEWICNSDAYNLTYVATKENNSPELQPFFPRMPLKSMSPEQLYESLMTAMKGERDPNKAAREEARTRWMSKLVRNFGDDEGNEMTFNGTIIQALLMMNGVELHGELTRADNKTAVNLAIVRGMKTSGNIGTKEEAVIDELFLTALGRHPSRDPGPYDPKTRRPAPSEISVIKSALEAAKREAASDPKASKTPDEAYKRFFQDVLWALVNTNEFILNH